MSERLAGACVDDATATAFVDGSLDDARAGSVEAHIDRCGECRELISALAARTRSPALVETLPATPDARRGAGQLVDEREGDPQVPPRLSRYRILGRLGAGGMGVVYRAFDDGLERQVALKLLHDDAAASDDAARERLLKEARALAKLHHPNVVTVHDVGRWDDQLYLAMELVEGTTLRRWLAIESHSIADILERFLAAGRGLAAAHAQGLVHRDFKPENVLCGPDGRVCVADFGLAREEEQASAESRPQASDFRLQTSEGEGEGARRADATRTGALVGTPAYMAPEQHLGRRADARSDQFAFCVALYEAITGAHPFGGGGAEQTKRVIEGRLAPPPAGARPIPRRFKAAIARGLSTDPAARWPSMNVLLAELSRRPLLARPEVYLAAALGVFVTVGVIAFVTLRPPATKPCGGAEKKLAGAWDAARRDQLRKAFTAVDRPFADGAFRRVEAELDAWGAAYTTSHVDACEATEVRREQSPEVLDRRMACLEERRRTVAAFTRLLSTTTDADVVARAPLAAAQLPDPRACDDAAALGVVPPPAPAEVRRVTELRAALAEAEAFHLAGRYLEARAAVEPVARAAEALGYRPLVAEARYREAAILDALGELDAAERGFLDAVAAAQSSRHDELAARAAAALVQIIGVRQARVDEGERLAKLAAASVERLGPDAAIRPTFLRYVGNLRAKQGKYDEALDQFTEALAIAERRGDDELTVATLLDSIGSTHEALGAFDQARAMYERALALRERLLGADHPELAITLENLGIVACRAGHCENGLPFVERALALAERSVGPESVRAVGLLGTLANVHRSLGHDDEAIAVYRRAVAAGAKALGPRHPDLAMHQSNLAAMLRKQGKLDEAEALHEQALATKRAAYGEDHPSVATSLMNLGVLLHERGDDARALAQTERALEIFRARLGEDHPNTALAHVNIAIALRALGRAKEALPHAERALEIQRAKLGDDDGQTEITKEELREIHKALRH